MPSKLVAIILTLLRKYVRFDLPTDCSGRSAAALPEDIHGDLS
jgi:hypothetical protein